MAFDPTTVRDYVDAFTAAGTLTERIDAFVALVRWTRQGANADSRLDAFLDQLDDPDERGRFQSAFGALIAETDGTNAFAHVGIPSERGFPAELGERLMNHVPPRPRSEQDLGCDRALPCPNDGDGQRHGIPIR